MKDKEKSTIYQKYISFINNETIGTKVVIYGISSVGLLYAMYAVRPFAKFRRPSDVPNHFVEDFISFKGTVAYVNPGVNSTLLMVNHQPIVPFPRWGKHKYLPVKLPGINITSNGVCWLQTIVVGKSVTFVPVSKQKEFVECIATMPQYNQAPLNIACELLKLGFGTVSNEKPESIHDSYLKLYWKSLMKAQKLAEQDRNGYWFLNTYPTFIWSTKMYLKNKTSSIIPKLKPM